MKSKVYLNRRIKLSLRLVFILSVFLIMLSAICSMGLIASILVQREVIELQNPRGGGLIWLLLLCSAIIGTILSAAANRGIYQPIRELNEAIKRVTKGDFQVSLKEGKGKGDIREMAVNFNKMVRELRGIETLRNDFVLNVSHEFKTPIAAIEGYATLLQSDSLSTEESAEYAKRIIVSTKQLSSLTENILKISKLENQEIVIEHETFRLDEQIRTAILLLEQEWSAKNLELEINLDSVKYCWSAELLLQVWVNLIKNAIKFTPDYGTIFVTLTKENEKIKATVADTGIGISEQAKTRIFEKFYQGEKSRNLDGNGLGLTLVKRIIDLCGGTIQVESQLGQGASFVVWLQEKPRDATSLQR